jgi:hypothetical protein
MKSASTIVENCKVVATQLTLWKSFNKLFARCFISNALERGEELLFESSRVEHQQRKEAYTRTLEQQRQTKQRGNKKRGKMQTESWHFQGFSFWHTTAG